MTGEKGKRTDLPRLLLTRRLPASVEALAERDFATLANPEDRILTADDLVKRACEHQAVALLVCLTERLSAETIRRLPESLKIISTFSVGTNHIDLAAAKERGIAVGFTPDATTDATADLTLFLLLATCRRAHEHQSALRSGQWGAWNAWAGLGMDPGGKVLGLVGMGRIGQAVAHRARSFGMHIAYHQRRRLSPELERDARYYPSLRALFTDSQIISLHTPSTPETIGQINQTSLGWLAPGAVLVNTARGDQLVDDAMISALRSGHLAAAGLDVFANEPNFDRRYLDLPNAYLLPHIGTSTEETRVRMGQDALENIRSFLISGKPRWSAL